MHESVRLGRLFGIPVGLHWSLLVILGLLTADLAVALPGDLTVAAVVVAALGAVALFASVLSHEIGHSIVARHHGVRVEGITLWLLGGIARLDGEIPTARAQFRIAVAGPLVSVALALGFAMFAALGDAMLVPAVLTGMLGWLALVNGVVAVFNLVPAAPLDGGRLLAAALWAHSGDQDQAQIGAAHAGQVFGWILIAFGFWAVLGGAGAAGLWPMLLGWFVLSMAEAEELAARVRREQRGDSSVSRTGP